MLSLRAVLYFSFLEVRPLWARGVWSPCRTRRLGALFLFQRTFTAHNVEPSLSLSLSLSLSHFADTPSQVFHWRRASLGGNIHKHIPWWVLPSISKFPEWKTPGVPCDLWLLQSWDWERQNQWSRDTEGFCLSGTVRKIPSDVLNSQGLGNWMAPCLTLP